MIDENGVMGIVKLDEQQIRERILARLGAKFLNGFEQLPMNDRTKSLIISEISDEIHAMQMEGVADPPFKPTVWFDHVTRVAHFHFRPVPEGPPIIPQRAARIDVIREIVDELLTEYADLVTAPERFALVFEADHIHVEVRAKGDAEHITIKGRIES